MFAAPLQATELVKNPSMEEGDVEWANWAAHNIVSPPIHSGNKSLEYTLRNWNAGHLTAPFNNFNVPIISGYIILSHWFGGWIVSGNTAIDDDKLPSTMQVDYVRVWSGQAAKNPTQDDH